ncbi:NAD-dependent epimerase/dehydratase family protein [Methylophilus sp. 'Pure River']|uniref:NAD-dependent epimerase/dehydratase family protein n=1 Tax=Methylophilus sp. 'Pure River' TaxID=3377117 RepID=UPI00398E3EFE
MQVLVTGASGFVGQTLCKQLAAHNHAYNVVRREALDPACYSGAYDCMIHLAGRAHVMHDKATDIYRAYATVNIEYTFKVAELARQLQIKRFVFLSSIKVNGEASVHPFTETDPPAPLDAYGKTKMEAEFVLREFCTKHQIELVIIRPPLIYGPGVKANFKQLIKLCLLPVPLPLASLNNKRSFVNLDNLVDFIILCCTHQQAANQTFLISDDEDMTIAELIRTVRRANQQTSRLFPVPPWLLQYLFEFIGKSGLTQRLLGTLQVDISKAKTLLGWQPILSFHDGIAKTLKETQSIC